MRIRSIKPEFWRSRHVAQLPWDLRLLFIGLWSYVDDNGVGVDDAWQITSDVFPVEDDPAVARVRVEEGLATLSREVREPSSLPFIVRYTVDGKRYLYITGWPHQRIDKPSKARYPKPPESVLTCENVNDRPDPRETLASPPESLAPLTEEQGNSSKRTSRTSRSGGYSDEFELWWRLYPKRKGSKGSKFEASKAWIKALRLVTAEVLTASLRAYLTTQQVQDGFPKDAVSWLNQRCWEDLEPDPPLADPTEWLRGEYRAGRVREVEERTGLRYELPDLPLDVRGADAAAAFYAEQGRKWITDNHDLIMSRLTERRTA